MYFLLLLFKSKLLQHYTLPRFLEATKGIMFSDSINDLSGQQINKEGIDDDQDWF